MSKMAKRSRKNVKESEEMAIDSPQKSSIGIPSPQSSKNKIVEDDQDFRIEIPYQKLNLSSNSIQQYNNKFLEDETVQNIIKAKSKLPFKKQNWTSKLRQKEKNARTAKNLKNLLTDNVDTQSYNIYQSIEAGPSFQPKIKYCDVTGFETQYQDPRTGLRYYNSDIYKLTQNMTEPIKNQYLSIRKALFIIK